MIKLFALHKLPFIFIKDICPLLSRFVCMLTVQSFQIRLPSRLHWQSWKCFVRRYERAHPWATSAHFRQKASCWELVAACMVICVIFKLICISKPICAKTNRNFTTMINAPFIWYSFVQPSNLSFIISFYPNSRNTATFNLNACFPRLQNEQWKRKSNTKLHNSLLFSVFCRLSSKPNSTRLSVSTHPVWA